MSIELGRRIKALRRLKLLTQQELAQKINISVSMLSNIERGQKNPPPQLLENIASLLNVPGDELFILAQEKSFTGVDPGAGRRAGL